MGTSRQPSTIWPSSQTICSRMPRHVARLGGIARQEDQADAVVAGGGKGDAEPAALAREERVRHLDE